LKHGEIVAKVKCTAEQKKKNKAKPTARQKKNKANNQV
jgi:hypothetical protein